MLVLNRRVGEAVCVGPGVTIRVMETRGGKVRLAIDAPADVRILRSELEPYTHSLPCGRASPLLGEKGRG